MPRHHTVLELASQRWLREQVLPNGPPVGRAKPSSVAVATPLGLLPFAQWNWGCGVWTKKMGRKMRKIGALGQKPKKAKKKVK